MEKYFKIKRLGHTDNEELVRYLDDVVYITEKLDGANARMWIDEGELVFGSRNVNNIDRGGSFGKFISYLEEKVNSEDLDQDYIYIGEFMKKQTLSYPEDTPPVVFYDILYKDNVTPIDYGVAMKEFKRLGLDYITPLYKGKLKKVKDNLEGFLEESDYREGKPEGIVIKNYDRTNRFGRQLFAKLVNEGFKEKHKASFKDSGGKKRSKIFNQMKYLADTYIPESRIKKVIFRLKDEEGREVNRSLMNCLIPLVIKDALDEEIVTIYNDEKIDVVDFKVLQQHKIVPIKCLDTIDKLMDQKVS